MAQIVKRARQGSEGRRTTYSYRVRWRYGGTREGEWQSVTMRSAEDAKSLRLAVEVRGHRVRATDPDVLDRSIITGERTRHIVPTFGEVAQRYIDTRTTAKANTRETYGRILRVHLAEWQSIPITDITSDDVAGLINRLLTDGRSPVAPYDFARSVLRYATNTEPPLRNGNPAALVRVPRGGKVRARYLTHAEADALLGAADETARPMLETMLNTGLRIGELLALRVRDLHTGEAPALTVAQAMRRAQGGQPAGPGEPKSDRSRRTIALDAYTAELLTDQAGGKGPDDYLFVNAHTCDHWRYSQWRESIWQPTIHRAALANPTRPHDLRHTHASWLLTDGVPLLVVSRRLGHESVMVTASVYGHIQPEADDVVRAVLAKRVAR